MDTGPIPVHSSTRRSLLGTTAALALTSHDWPELPDEMKFGNTHGIVADGQGRPIIAHTVHSTSKSNDAIAIFDANGKFVKS
jgi:hypothetical protein